MLDAPTMKIDEKDKRKAKSSILRLMRLNWPTSGHVLQAYLLKEATFFCGGCIVGGLEIFIIFVFLLY